MTKSQPTPPLALTRSVEYMREIINEWIAK
jgi:hypothetical protein